MQDYNVELIAKGDGQSRFIGVGLNDYQQVVGAFSLEVKDNNGLRSGTADFNFSKPRAIYYIDIFKPAKDGVAYVKDKRSGRLDVFGKVTTENDDADDFLVKMTVEPMYDVGGKQVIRCPQIFRGYEGNTLTG